MNKIKIILALGLLQLVVGCSMNAPQYQPDFNSVNSLKDTSTPDLTSGHFTEVDPSLNKISLRGSSLHSPYEDSYGTYLKNAVEEQLKQASKWDEASDLIISGTLLKNDVDASGFSIGEANLSAEFVLSVRGKIVYQKVHSIHHEWASSFVGAVAIPNAVNNYSIAVQKLVAALFEDSEFKAIIDVMDGA